MSTVYYQIVRPGEPLRADSWRARKNCKPTDDVAAHLAHTYAIRNGLQVAELDVCFFDDWTPCHPNGAPKECRVTRVRVRQDHHKVSSHQ